MKEKLYSKEYFDIYGISLLKINNILEDNYLLALILPIAEKYLRITLTALRTEARHFLSSFKFKDYCGETYLKHGNVINKRLTNKYIYNYNKNILKNHNITSKRGYRKNLSLEILSEIFKNGIWLNQYGGYQWHIICKLALELERYIKYQNMNKLIFIIDRLNDTEHNNALYLESCCSFNFKDISYDRGGMGEPDLFLKCSPEIRKLGYKYRVMNIKN